MGSTVAVIPARGGSKGVPGKNLTKVGGVPLVVRSIRAALSATRIDAVFVSSDDKTILEIAAQAGAGKIRRPADIAGDLASSESALLSALDDPAIASLSPDLLVMIQCTSPFTSAGDLDSLVATLDDARFDAALTVVENHGFLWGIAEDGSGRGLNHDASEPRKRRQDLPPQYLETGAAYAMRAESFRKTETRFCGPVGLVPTSHLPVEIDTVEDLDQARAIATAIDSPDALIPSLARIRALVTDFDGVHTDDTVSVDEDGRETVRCSRSDGMGIERLRQAGMPILILSKETNAVVARRAEKLKLPVIHGENDKLLALRKWADENGIDLDTICFVGNDVNDIACMQAAGLAVAPRDARREALAVADLILDKAGGKGAVREICEKLLLAIGDSSEQTGLNRKEPLNDL